MEINWRGAVVCGVVLILTGCSNALPVGTPSAIPEPSTSPTLTIIAEPVDATVAFREIAHASCDKAGQEVDLGLTFNEADGTYQTTLDQGPDQDPFVATYSVSNGLIVQQHIDADWGETTVEVTYGMPSEEDIAFLQTAVDAFLAENG